MKRPPGLKVHRKLISAADIKALFAQPEFENPAGQLFRLYGDFGGKQAEAPRSWMAEWGARLREQGLFREQPNQYRICDWIGEHSAQFKWHINNHRHGERILVLCLSDDRVIGFRPRDKPHKQYDLELEAGDAYLINGAARWSWEHCVLPRGPGRSGGRSFVVAHKRA